MDLLILQIYLLEIKVIQFGNLKVEKGVNSSVDAVLSENAAFFVKKTKSSNISQNITFRENLVAPIEKGEVIGSVNFTLDGEVIKSANIVAKDSIKKINLINMTMNIYENWFKLLRQT